MRWAEGELKKVYEVLTRGALAAERKPVTVLFADVTGRRRGIASARPDVNPHREKETAMPLQTRYLFSAAMDVEPTREALFNEVYDAEHVPILLSVPGVISVARLKVRPLTMILGGEKKTIVFDKEPRYNALYEIESPEVLTSDAWSRAVDRGRWTSEVRPHTSNRRHLLYERLG